jgi:hypothetical protein
MVTVVISFVDRTDSSGIQFYIGKELRQHDLGYLSFGTGPNPASLAIPPRVNGFIIDSYCLPRATQVSMQHNKSFISFINRIYLNLVSHFCQPFLTLTCKASNLFQLTRVKSVFDI